MMLILGWLAVMLFLTQAVGQVAPITSSVDGAPGEFVALGFQVRSGSTLSVEAPPFFTLTSEPAVRDGRATVFLYIANEAPAGEHLVVVRAATGPPVSVIVNVSRRTGIDLSAGEDMTVVQGEPLALTFTVHNTGNAADRVEVEISSRLGIRQTRQTLDIEAGARAEVVFETVGGATAGGDVAVVTATPLSDPEESRFVILRTRVLPFAGAENLDGPTLAYRVAATETYGTAGWRTRASASLEGGLSDHVSGSANVVLDWPNGVDPSVSGAVALSGDAWAVRYRAAPGVHRLDGRYLDFEAFSYLSAETFGVGASYSSGDLFVNGSHTYTTTDTQTVSAGYNFRVTPEFMLTPTLTASRTSVGGTSITGGASLTATLSSEPVLGVLRVQSPFPVNDDWQVTAAISSRLREPVGFRADASVTRDRIVGNLTVTETINDELRLHQRFAYDASSRLTFGVRYSPRPVPLLVSADATASLAAGTLWVAYALSTAYRPAPYSVSAFVQGDVGGVPAYGGSVGYRSGGFASAVGYRHSAGANTATVSVSVDDVQFSVSANYGYDLLDSGHSGGFSAEYDSREGYMLFGSLTLTDDLRWEVGATLSVSGGFATPERVIDAFGGREGGVMTGVVFHDSDRDGVRSEDEPPVVGATLVFGATSTTTDEDGRYRLVIPAGTYEPRLSGLDASLELVGGPTVEVALNSTNHLDLAVRTVATLLVTLFEDENRDGARDDNEYPLSGLTVSLEAATGGVTRRATDARGEAVFQGLEPGPYVAFIDPEALPENYEGTTGAVGVKVQSGPPARIELGVVRRAPEIVQTLARGDISMVATVEPAPVPAGADLLVKVAISGGDAAVSAALPGGAPAMLARELDGAYRGRVNIPSNAVGVVLLTVVAENADKRLEQVIPIVVNDGPLARVTVTPAFAESGEVLTVEVAMLTLVETLELVFDGQSLDLAGGTDPYRFTGALKAPGETGSYLVEVIADGVKVAEGRFRVE